MCHPVRLSRSGTLSGGSLPTDPGGLKRRLPYCDRDTKIQIDVEVKVDDGRGEMNSDRDASTFLSVSKHDGRRPKNL